jgi:hypothetical protein
LDEIRKLTKAKIYFFVKARPIVNDALVEDAKVAGIDRIENLEIKTIKNGFSIHDLDDDSFSRQLKLADLVISKGQANYESLSEFKANIYFLLIAKCSVIARDLKVNKGSMIIKDWR